MRALVFVVFLSACVSASQTVVVQPAPAGDNVTIEDDGPNCSTGPSGQRVCGNAFVEEGSLCCPDGDASCPNGVPRCKQPDDSDGLLFVVGLLTGLLL
jgi:hypothetical protein